MAYKEIRGTKKLQGTAAELAAMTAEQKAAITEGSTYWCWDTKAGYVFASGDWRSVA